MFSFADLTKLMIVGGVDEYSGETIDETEIVDVSGLNLQCSTPGQYPMKVGANTCSVFFENASAYRRENRQNSIMLFDT